MMGMNPEPNPGDTYKWGNEIKTQIIWHNSDNGVDYWVPVTPPPEPMNSDYARIRQWVEDGKITILDPDPAPAVLGPAPPPPPAAA